MDESRFLCRVNQPRQHAADDRQAAGDGPMAVKAPHLSPPVDQLSGRRTGTAGRNFQITPAQSIHAVAKQNHNDPRKDEDEFGRIPDGGKIGQMIKQRIKPGGIVFFGKRRKPPPSQRQRQGQHRRPEPDEPLFTDGEHGIFPAERLGDGPRRQQHDQDACIRAAPGETHETGRLLALPATIKIAVNGWIASDTAPILTTFVGALQLRHHVVGRVHLVTKNSGNKDREGFRFGQAPLRGPIPMASLGFLILPRASDAADGRTNQ